MPAVPAAHLVMIQAQVVFGLANDDLYGDALDDQPAQIVPPPPPRPLSSAISKCLPPTADT